MLYFQLAAVFSNVRLNQQSNRSQRSARMFILNFVIGWNFLVLKNSRKNFAVKDKTFKGYILETQLELAVIIIDMSFSCGYFLANISSLGINKRNFVNAFSPLGLALFFFADKNRLKHILDPLCCKIKWLHKGCN